MVITEKVLREKIKPVFVYNQISKMDKVTGHYDAAICTWSYIL